MTFDLMSKCCNQCLMTKNKVVSDRRRSEIIRKTVQQDCSFICHKGSIAEREIACRGHYELTGGGQLARIAGRLGAIRLIDPETMQPVEGAP